MLRQVSEALERQGEQTEIEPLFAPGNYRETSNVFVANNRPNFGHLLQAVANDVGVPVRWGNVHFFAAHASKLLALDTDDDTHRYALAIRVASSDTDNTLQKVFSRVQIARLSQIEAHRLWVQCFDAVSLWSVAHTKANGATTEYVVSRLRVFVEVLARVSVRTSPELALRAYRLAISLGKTEAFHHWWLFAALNNLFDYALESIPASRHGELLFDALSFPLHSETGITQHEDDWPNPVIEGVGARSSNAALDRRIDEIIDAVAPCSSNSRSALLRLLPLLDQGFLKDSERLRLIEKIWGSTWGEQTLPETGLLKFAFLLLPSHDSDATKMLVRTYLFNVSDEKLFDLSLLLDIASAAQADGRNELPSEDQAYDYFNRLVAWRPQKDAALQFGFAHHDEKQRGNLIGEVLAHSVVPSLRSDALTEANFAKLSAFCAEVNAPKAFIALSHFAVSNGGFSNRVEKTIRQGLQGRDSNKAACASYAILKWAELSSSPSTARLVSRLIYQIGSSRSVGLPSLLRTTNQMLKKHYLSEQDIDELAEIVPLVFDGAGYAEVNFASREAVSVSLLRAACVRLAADILLMTGNCNAGLSRVLEEASRDPLPEVRFAVTG